MQVACSVLSKAAFRLENTLDGLYHTYSGSTYSSCRHIQRGDRVSLRAMAPFNRQPRPDHSILDQCRPKAYYTPRLRNDSPTRVQVRPVQPVPLIDRELKVSTCPHQQHLLLIILIPVSMLRTSCQHGIKSLSKLMQEGYPGIYCVLSTTNELCSLLLFAHMELIVQEPLAPLEVKGCLEQQASHLSRKTVCISAA